MQNKRLWLFVGGLLAFLAITFTLVLVSVVISNTKPERINVTRAEYEAALARWKAQNILEYEITTRTDAYLGVLRKLRVSDGGKNIIAYDMYPDPGATPRPPSTPEPDLRKYFEVDTVEGMFVDVEAMLDE